jgi:cytidylate kinase
MKQYAITIGRQCGSGGREIGEKLADALNVKCYDKEILSESAKNSGLCEEIFHNNDEKPTSSFLYSLVMDVSGGSYSGAAYLDMPLNHKVFLAQFQTIKQIAAKEPAIFIGRCADYALAENPNLIRIFIHAPIEDRIARISKIRDLTPNKAKDLISKTDKRRASYYNYYSEGKWGEASNYDLSINSSLLGIDGTIEVLKNFILKK